jgi:SAM-dependent methyltransferase
MPAPDRRSEPVDYPPFVARFYDTVYASLRDGVDNAYYLERARAARGPVLEIGVGTGRLFRAAREQGVDAWGVDVSPAMLERLHEKLAPAERDRVRLADGTRLELGRRFALVLAPFRVLSHVGDVDEQLRLLERVHGHLEPGGTFIFDLFVPSLPMLATGLPPTVDFDGEWKPGRYLRRTVEAKSDLTAQITRVRMGFAWQEEDGSELHDEWTFDMRFFFRWEIEHLVARSPLDLVTIHGDFEAGPLLPESREFVVVCRRS